MKVKPQLDEAIAYLQAEIAALCAEDKEENLLELAVAVAGGEAPLPEAQFGPLLALWTPKTSSIASDLAALVDQFKASKQREEEEEKGHLEEEDRDVKTGVCSAFERVREERKRPRTRPRRRFEDLETCDVSSDDTPTSTPRTDGNATDMKEKMEEKEKKEDKVEKEKEEEKMKEKKKDVEMEEKKDEEIQDNTEKEKKKDVEMDEKTEKEEKKDVEMEKSTEKAEEKKMEIEEKQIKSKEKPMADVVVEKEESVEKDEEKEKDEVEKDDEVEAAMASLKALRKMMLLDVLSKIVSVAKSKEVDPAMFTRENVKNGENQVGKDKNQVDLTNIHDRVAEGVICEWAQFAEQVYLFCQHVVTDAEKCEQPEARRKGVELLHFARTLTETLRKASLTKEAALLQKIREAEMKVAARKREKEAARNEKAMKNDTVDESTANKNDDQAMEATASNNHSSNSKTANDEPLDSEAFSPSRASTRIRKRPSIASDGTGSAAASPSSRNSRKRMRVALSAASASEEVSGSESHDASASEADTKSRGQSKTTKSPAKRTPARRRRPSLPATRISSRQQKRRAAAAAAAGAADSTGTGNEEEHSGSEALHSVAEKEGDEANEKKNDEEEETTNVEQDEGQSTPKKKKAAPKPRSRKKGWRKR